MGSQCEVCGEAGGPAVKGFNRVGGVDVCDPCYLGLAPARVRARGWAFDIRQWEVRDNEGSVVGYGTHATLRLPQSVGMDLKCRRKTFLWRLFQIVKPGISVGDSLFDNHVYARSKNVGFTRMVLGDDGVQSILMDMLGEGSWITVNRDTIVSHSIRGDYVSEAQFSSEMCVLASHVERIRKSQGMGSPR